MPIWAERTGKRQSDDIKPIVDEQRGRVSLLYSIAVGGGASHGWGNTSEMVVGIDSDSFNDLAKAMMKANPEATIKAFGKALQSFKR